MIAPIVGLVSVMMINRDSKVELSVKAEEESPDQRTTWPLYLYEYGCVVLVRTGLLEVPPYFKHRKQVPLLSTGYPYVHIYILPVGCIIDYQLMVTLPPQDVITRWGPDCMGNVWDLRGSTHKPRI
jgi:hypothetical protein